MNPYHQDNFEELSECINIRADISRPVSMRPVFSGEYFKSVIAFPVIVEAWDKLKRSGSKRRRYHLEFTATERKLISSYYRKFYRWYLVTGTPDKVMVSLKTVELLNRAVNFFSEV
jgi:hypothetical protein